MTTAEVFQHLQHVRFLQNIPATLKQMFEDNEWAWEIHIRDYGTMQSISHGPPDSRAIYAHKYAKVQVCPGDSDDTLWLKAENAMTDMIESPLVIPTAAY